MSIASTVQTICFTMTSLWFHKLPALCNLLSQGEEMHLVYKDRDRKNKWTTVLSLTTSTFYVNFFLHFKRVHGCILSKLIGSLTCKYCNALSIPLSCCQFDMLPLPWSLLFFQLFLSVLGALHCPDFLHSSITYFLANALHHSAWSRPLYQGAYACACWNVISITTSLDMLGVEKLLLSQRSGWRSMFWGGLSWTWSTPWHSNWWNSILWMVSLPTSSS